MLDGIAMKVARCGSRWHASRIVSGMQRDDLNLFAFCLTALQSLNTVATT